MAQGVPYHSRTELKMDDVEDLIDDLKRLNNRVSSVNNMKQIGLAFHNYCQARRTFPPACTVDRSGKPLLSWRVLILPYLGRPDLYDDFHLDEPWNIAHNKGLLTKMPANLRLPRQRRFRSREDQLFDGAGQRHDFRRRSGLHVRLDPRRDI